jgi:hypothetical protein
MREFRQSQFSESKSTSRINYIKNMDQKPKVLLDRVREKIRLKNDSNQTEKIGLNWIKQHLFFHDKYHPQDMGAFKIEAFINHLAVDSNMAASTQNRLPCIPSATPWLPICS